MSRRNMTSIIGFLGALAFVIGVSGPVLGQAPPPAGPLEDIQSTLAEILAALGNLTTDVPISPRTFPISKMGMSRLI
jgi:hypothetical protein